MSSKLLSIALTIFIIFSTVITSNANAGLLTGGVYTDSAAEDWEYVGFYDLRDGPNWFFVDGYEADHTDPDGSHHSLGYDVVSGTGTTADPFIYAGHGDFATPLNGLEAAALLFPSLNIDELAISTLLNIDLADISEGDVIVDHEAFYDTSIGGTEALGENIDADVNDDGVYGQGDSSAYISDHSQTNPASKINYVFKKVTDVPEPSTLAIFALALFGLGARRLKN